MNTQHFFRLALRERLLIRFFDITNPLHGMIHYKRIPWRLSSQELRKYPKETVGYMLGAFLETNKLTPFDRAEKHDVFHVLLGYKTDVKNEAAMQFFLLGNGKYSPFTLGTSFLAALALPEAWRYFIIQYKRGKKAHPLSGWNFKELLNENMEDVRNLIFNREIQNESLMYKINQFEKE